MVSRKLETLALIDFALGFLGGIACLFIFSESPGFGVSDKSIFIGIVFFFLNLVLSYILSGFAIIVKHYEKQNPSEITENKTLYE